MESQKIISLKEGKEVGKKKQTIDKWDKEKAQNEIFHLNKHIDNNKNESTKC